MTFVCTRRKQSSEIPTTRHGGLVC